MKNINKITINIFVLILGGLSLTSYFFVKYEYVASQARANKNNNITLLSFIPYLRIVKKIDNPDKTVARIKTKLFLFGSNEILLI